MKTVTDMVEEIKTLHELVENLIVVVSNSDRRTLLLDDWISEKQAIAVTGLSRGTLLKLCNEGKTIKSTLSGKSNFYRLSDFKSLLEKNEKNR